MVVCSTGQGGVARLAVCKQANTRPDIYLAQQQQQHSDRSETSTPLEFYSTTSPSPTNITAIPVSVAATKIKQSHRCGPTINCFCFE